MSLKKVLLFICAALVLIMLSACALQDTSAEYDLQGTPDNVFVTDTLTFRAEVLEFDLDYYFPSHDLLFVSSITSVMGFEVGGRYRISKNPYVTILDVYGEPIESSAVLPGTIVDITYGGTVFLRDPAIIPHATLIQIVE